MLLDGVGSSKLKMLLQGCNSNWRRFSIGCSVLTSPRKLIPIEHGSPYSASQVEEALSSLKVKGEGTECTAYNAFLFKQ